MPKKMAVTLPWPRHLLRKFVGVMSGLSLGSRLSNLNPVALTVLELLTKAPFYLFWKRGVAISRDSQRFTVPLIFQEWVKLWMWNLLIKQEVLNMRCLTNKTANIKYKNLSVYKTAWERLSYKYKTAKLFFSEKLMKQTDGFFISSLYQLFWEKRFLLFWICDSVALTQFCKLISFCI